MATKTRILVTGANKGIGKAIVAKLLSDYADTEVLLGARDSSRGEEAVRELATDHPEWGRRVSFLLLDPSSEESIKAAAAHVAKVYGSDPAPLRCVINNAGTADWGEATLEAFNAMVAVNVMGVHNVTAAFLPLLDANGGRIVNVSSAAGPMFVAKCSEEVQRQLTSPTATWDFACKVMGTAREALGSADKAAAFSAAGFGELSSFSCYGLSKALVNVETRAVARENPALQVNAVTPGYIETDLTKPHAEANGKSPAEMGMKPPSAGAVAPVHLAMGDHKHTGSYFGSDALRSPWDRYRGPGEPEYQGE